MRVAAAVSAALVSLFAGLMGVRAEELGPDQYAKPAQMLKVQGDRRLNFLCMGVGAPTVVLEAGGGGYSPAWRRVQPEIAKFTRVCAYDRAGYGFSDAADRPSTAGNYVADLHAAITTGLGGGQIILVGHSAGGLYATLYADLHRTDLAGLLLVDPMIARQSEIYARGLSTQEGERRDRMLADDKLRRRNCATFARDGSLQEHAAECIRVPAGISPALADVYGAHLLDRKAYEASISEDDALYPLKFGGLSEDDRQELAAAKGFGDLPLVILVAQANDRGAPQRAWIAGVGKLAARSSKGKVVAVPDSGHNIQLDQPGSIVETVRAMMSAARAVQ